MKLLLSTGLLAVLASVVSGDTVTSRLVVHVSIL
jgi:hypothetical protein